MEVRLATSEEMDDVFRLVHDEYVRAGYCTPRHDGLLKHYPHLDYIPETFVFVAVEDNKIIGTNSLTLDGCMKLHVDCDFPEHVEQIRQELLIDNHKLAASWRIATHPNARKQMVVILNLIHITFKAMVDNYLHTCLFTFNPKHERFYHKLLGFDTVSIGHCKATMASAVLMKGTVWNTMQKWPSVCARRGIVNDIDMEKLIPEF